MRKKQKNICLYGGLKLKNEFNKFLQLIGSERYPAILSEHQINNNFKLLFSNSLFKKSIEISNSDLSVVCPGCEDKCLETAFYIEELEKFFVDCGYKDEMGLVEIEREHCVINRFKILPFLNWINEKLKLDDEVREENPQGLIWFLGKL